MFEKLCMFVEIVVGICPRNVLTFFFTKQVCEFYFATCNRTRRLKQNLFKVITEKDMGCMVQRT